jgi:imidazolonepropionase-like amidohydrolase
MRRTLTLLLFCAAIAGAQTLVVQNGTIHTVTKGTFQGSIVIVNGKITEVGQKVMTPPGAKIVDASGKHVIPGIIDAHTHIALDSINEGSISVASMVRMSDMVNPNAKAIYHAMAGGVTTVMALHGSADSIGGQNAIIKLRWGQPAAGLMFKGAPPSLKMALGENVKRAGMGSGFQMPGQPSNLRYPGTRMGTEDVIRDAYTRAREYQKQWKEYEARKARGENVIAPRRDLELEPLVEVLEGKRIVHVHSYRADEILMMMRVFDEFNIHNVTWVHVMEGYKVAKEIAARGDYATTFSDWWNYKMEVVDSTPYNAAILYKKGIVVSLNSDDAGPAELSRRLNTEAAKAVKYGGVPDNDALAMITINPAKQLGVDKYVGSLEAGKDADFVIYDKDPLSIYSKVEKVFIDGKQYFDRDADLTERPKDEARKKGLIEKERETERKAAPQPRRPQ